jgi:hypothetical protein
VLCVAFGVFLETAGARQAGGRATILSTLACRSTSVNTWQRNVCVGGQRQYELPTKQHEVPAAETKAVKVVHIYGWWDCMQSYGMLQVL